MTITPSSTGLSLAVSQVTMMEVTSQAVQKKPFSPFLSSLLHPTFDHQLSIRILFLHR